MKSYIVFLLFGTLQNLLNIKHISSKICYLLTFSYASGEHVGREALKSFLKGLS